LLDVAIGGQNKVTILFVVADETFSQLPWMVLESIRNTGPWLAISSSVCCFVVVFHVCKYCLTLFMFCLGTPCARENILFW